ncbi:MAG: hypothetical protein M1354_04105 [Candidatus Marsarchaeota archaeon]|nr:hypothetical protein [Candidatus Marsarchaeota archaeon]
MEELEVYRSRDNRHRTAPFRRNGLQAFCIAERTRKGVLVTEFSQGGGVLNQTYMDGSDAGEALSRYLGTGFAVVVKNTGDYPGVELKARCTGCGGRVVRELDAMMPEEIGDVPVVPLFSCAMCRKRFYSMTDSYLRRLVDANISLFEAGELAEKAKDSDAFINTLREYIVRILASKKMSRLAIE